jgi:hypothetical protein
MMRTIPQTVANPTFISHLTYFKVIDLERHPHPHPWKWFPDSKRRDLPSLARRRYYGLSDREKPEAMLTGPFLDKTNVVSSDEDASESTSLLKQKPIKY